MTLGRDGKKRWVVFHKDGARVYKGPRPNTQDPMLEDPDLTAVVGVAPHHWRKRGERVVPALGHKGLYLPEMERRSRVRIIMVSFIVGTTLGTCAGAAFMSLF